MTNFDPASLPLRSAAPPPEFYAAEQPVDEVDYVRRGLVVAAAIGVGLVATGCSGGGGSSEATPRPSGNDDEASQGPKGPSVAIHEGLSASTDPQLRLMATHERELGRGFPEMMIFIGMPSKASIAEQAAKDAARLREMAKFNIKPYVVFEPESTDTGDLIDLHHMPTGTIQAYFAELKRLGVTDAQMGTWAPLPEANIPAWAGEITDPALFRSNFTAIGQALRGVFPDAGLSLLLNWKTYRHGDWGQPSANAEDLLAYATGLDVRVDEFCLQGFAWGNDTVDPKQFLNRSLATTVAARLGSSSRAAKIRLNTGTYSTQHNPDTGGVDKLTVAQRRQIMDGILEEATWAHRAGFDVTVNVFGQDKAKDEADWSYGGAAAPVLKDFMDKADAEGLHTMLFDAK